MQAEEAGIEVRELCDKAAAIRRNHPREALRLAEKALGLARPLDDPVLIAEALSCAALCHEVVGNHPTALHQLNQAHTMYAEADETDKVHDVLNMLGKVYTKTGEYDKALQLLQQTFEYREKAGDKKGLISTLNLLGHVYKAFGDTDKALDHYFQALRYAEDKGDLNSTGIAFNNIGNCYYRIADCERAREFYERSIRIRKQLGDRYGQAVTLGNLGNVYNLMGDYERALEIQQESYDIRHDLDDKYGQAYVLGNIADIYISTQRPDDAIEHFYKALELCELTNSRSQMARILTSMSHIYALQGKFEEALEALDKAMGFATETGELTIQFDTHEEYAKTYAAMSNYKAAFMHQSKCLELRESLYDQDKQKIATYLRVRYELDTAEKEKEIYRLRNVELEKANKEILHQRNILEKQSLEIESANARLIEKNMELEKVDREKNDFLGVAAHDLKNPLSAIMLIGKNLREKCQQSEEVIELANDVVTMSKRMFELVTNLLDINAIEQGRIHINAQVFDIAPLAAALLNSYREPAGLKDITLHFDNDAVDSNVFADSNLVRQILDNLISNAVKYSHLGSEASLSICTPLRSVDRSITLPASIKRYVRIEIKDGGPGISENDKKKLFQKFARLSAKPTGGEHSTGLGLSIVKRLVEAMYGRIWCESEYGKGATFIVEFPQFQPYETLKAEKDLV